ncbi:MAG: cell division protein ZapE [Gammaproteobacteria bacterium]|nr:AFG1 family ATPase [Pseudomonadales bacterium]MCP5345543.1 cell division protein ZapE [Pseudomonadales bacterium]
MTPLQRYHRDLDEGLIQEDAAQRSAIAKLEALYQQLLAQRNGKPGLLQGWFARFRAGDRPAPPRGLYFWGGVGRGKTYLMDVFHDALPFSDKQRTHFHRFMQRVHLDLRDLRGEKNPLRQVAAGIAEQATVFCLDEFFVSDIGDAMILAGLLDALFEQGVVLVTTSNSEPGRLYENGLQRARFLPAIRLLAEHLDVCHLDGGTDYRLRNLSRAELYHHPLGEDSDALLYRSFSSLAPDFAEAEQDTGVEILGRNVPCRYLSDDVVWFDFDQLCGGPRSVHDYIELARIYHAVLVGNVPQLGIEREDQARRFVNLVDELYDRGVKLILTAAVPLTDLYAGSSLQQEFQRTMSRLLEMQSHAYLARPHRP